MKGGVGKTTLTAHLAGQFSKYDNGQRHRNILMIDYDPQFNLSQTYIPVADYALLEKNKNTILSVLLDDPTSLDPFKLHVSGNETPPAVADLEYVITKQSARNGKLAIIPSTLDLMYVALAEPETRTKPIEERFKKFINEARSLYDVVFIDCHPAGSIFTKTALRNSDDVIIPVVDESYSIRGIGLMLSFIETQKVGNSGPIPHIIFNRMPRNGVTGAENTIRGNPKLSSKCLTQTIKRYTVFSEPKEGRGFVWSSGKPWSTEAFRNLSGVAKEIASKLNLP